MRIDPRAGSKELVGPLRALGVEVEEVLLDSDAEIIGRGPYGEPTLVGVEYKTLEDAIACMRNGRFADQLRRMKSSYHVSWLLLEGRLKHDGRKLWVRRGEKWFLIPGNVTYQELAAWVDTMVLCGGVLVWRTENKEESASWLRALELWWGKEWEGHSAHLEWYTPPIVGNPFEGEPPLVQKAAALLPGIGSTKARKVAKEFKSLKKMCCVSQEEWATIPSVGKKMAAKIVQAIEEEA